MAAISSRPEGTAVPQKMRLPGSGLAGISNETISTSQPLINNQRSRRACRSCRPPGSIAVCWREELGAG